MFIYFILYIYTFYILYIYIYKEVCSETILRYHLKPDMSIRYFGIFNQKTFCLLFSFFV